MNTNVKALPEGARRVTNAILTRGNRVKQGWEARAADGSMTYYHTYHYPGALNFQQIEQLDQKPEWAT